MHYGRTLLELFVAQAIVLTAILVMPTGVVASFGMAGATTLAGIVACGLYLRHRARIAGSHAVATVARANRRASTQPTRSAIA